MDATISSVAKITFVVAEITFKVAVITSSVVKITFVVTEIIFKVAVVVVNHCFTSLFGTKGLLSDIIIR